jgi:hypothetical protein
MCRSTNAIAGGKSNANSNSYTSAYTNSNSYTSAYTNAYTTTVLSIFFMRCKSSLRKS